MLKFVKDGDEKIAILKTNKRTFRIIKRENEQALKIKNCQKRISAPHFEKESSVDIDV